MSSTAVEVAQEAIYRKFLSGEAIMSGIRTGVGLNPAGHVDNLIIEQFPPLIARRLVSHCLGKKTDLGYFSARQGLTPKEIAEELSQASRQFLFDIDTNHRASVIERLGGVQGPLVDLLAPGRDNSPVRRILRLKTHVELRKQRRAGLLAGDTSTASFERSLIEATGLDADSAPDGLIIEAVIGPLAALLSKNPGITDRQLRTALTRYNRVLSQGTFADKQTGQETTAPSRLFAITPAILDFAIPEAIEDSPHFPLHSAIARRQEAARLALNMTVVEMIGTTADPGQQAITRLVIPPERPM